jgi:hypothetical protein
VLDRELFAMAFSAKMMRTCMRSTWFCWLID